jgi:hypothetical protein
MAQHVRVWQGQDRELQHFSAPPGDDTAKRWEGTTACGLAGELTWIAPERVDAGSQCPACESEVGTAPALEGDDLGPV